MIRLVVGNVGSGKTCSVVRDMALHESDLPTYTNIVTKGIPNVTLITRDMLIVRDEKSKKEKLNMQYWIDQAQKHDGLNVVIDEAHTIFNARRSMSKQNIILSDFIALIRRIVGGKSGEYGELCLITQNINRVDVIIRNQATRVQYHILHYRKFCKKCGFSIQYNNECPEELTYCPHCKRVKLQKRSFLLEKFFFQKSEYCSAWLVTGNKELYYRRSVVTDLPMYFRYYNTFQLDNLFTEM